jgi:hypothetical protein
MLYVERPEQYYMTSVNPKRKRTLSNALGGLVYEDKSENCFAAGARAMLTALLCACAGTPSEGEWKTTMKRALRIEFKGNGTGVLYTPMFGAELENELTWAVDGVQLTIGFVNADGTESPGGRHDSKRYVHLHGIETSSIQG